MKKTLKTNARMQDKKHLHEGSATTGSSVVVTLKTKPPFWEAIFIFGSENFCAVEKT